MEIKQTTINHLLKQLATQLRDLDSIKTGLGQSLLISMACKAASKTIAQLQKLGVDHEEAYDRAETLNKTLIA